jgi:hypothetical protein
MPLTCSCPGRGPTFSHGLFLSLSLGKGFLLRPTKSSLKGPSGNLSFSLSRGLTEETASTLIFGKIKKQNVTQREFRGIRIWILREICENPL